MTASTNEYALALSDVEVARYQLMAERAHRHEAAHWVAAGIVAGAVVADVGCGPGAVSTLAARLVAPGGQVWAVDQNPEAVASAERLAATLALDNVRCRVGSATATGLDPGTFDVVFMRHVLAHNGGREQQIVDHLASLLRPGGCLYLVDIEYQGMRSRPPAGDLDELAQRYWSFQTARGNDLSIGLRLDQLVTAAGLELLEHRGWYETMALTPGFRPPSWAARHAMTEAGFATQDDIDRWAAAFEREDEAPERRLLFLPHFSATGRRVA
jgi:2-polyprenyl-3-methyl-5-hydroxy-6-metoxy-1,4-benzoquinol methylase